MLSCQHDVICSNTMSLADLEKNDEFSLYFSDKILGEINTHVILIHYFN